MKKLGVAAVSLAIAVALAIGTGILDGELVAHVATGMDQLASPGDLSAAHTHLSEDCDACHTPVVGVDPLKCALCHANDETLLKREPTRFHTSVRTCKACHREHEGLDHRLSGMDHAALASIGLRELETAEAGTEDALASRVLAERLRLNASPHPRISVLESSLDCGHCHGSADRHQRLFGADCAECHATDRWTIPEFRHPSPASHDCNQCHQGPPSHYMMHFSMISARVAGKPHAAVRECGACHQTTSWNDIKDAGWYKHH